MIRSTPSAPAPTTASSSSKAKARVPCSFQLPATILRRMTAPNQRSRKPSGAPSGGQARRVCPPASATTGKPLLQLDLAKPLFQVALRRDRLGIAAGGVRGDRRRQNVDHEIRDGGQEKR